MWGHIILCLQNWKKNFSVYPSNIHFIYKEMWTNSNILYELNVNYNFYNQMTEVISGIFGRECDTYDNYNDSTFFFDKGLMKSCVVAQKVQDQVRKSL